MKAIKNLVIAASQVPHPTKIKIHCPQFISSKCMILRDGIFVNPLGLGVCQSYEGLGGLIINNNDPVVIVVLKISTSLITRIDIGNTGGVVPPTGAELKDTLANSSCTHFILAFSFFLLALSSSILFLLFIFLDFFFSPPSLITLPLYLIRHLLNSKFIYHHLRLHNHEI